MNCLIVDDHPLSAFALSKILEAKFPTWNILKTDGVQKAISYITGQLIDLILLDLQLGEENGLTLLTYLQETPPIYQSQCIVVSNISDLKTIELCKELGACAYVQKKDVIHSIFPVIQDVISTNAKLRMPSPGDKKEVLCPPYKLTHRQRDILDLLLSGYSNKLIAHTLNLSYGTVKNYVFDLMRLMSVNSRLEMAMKLQQTGYTPRKTSQSETRATDNL